jgi:hypothetical protein
MTLIQLCGYAIGAGGNYGKGSQTKAYAGSVRNLICFTAFSGYVPFDLDQYFDHNTACGIFTKRDCDFRYTFYPHRSLEGTRYRLKSLQRVVINKADAESLR